MRGAGWLLLGLCACGKPTAPSPSTTPAVSHDASADKAPRCAPPVPLPATNHAHRLPFGFYSLPKDRFADVARAGVTMVGPYYGAPPGADLLDAAAAEGLEVIHAVGLPSAKLDETGLLELQAQIDAVVEHEALAAWYVLPEELRPWSAQEMGYASAVRSELKARDPKARPSLSYQPNHRRRRELTQASAALDVVSRGLYANFVGANTKRAWLRTGVETIVAATTAEQTPWAVLEMFAQPDERYAGAHRIRATVRHDVYASLIGGARGVLVFSGWPRANFPAYDDYLAAYLEVADELNGDRALAHPLLDGDVEPGDGIAVEHIGGPKLVDASLSPMPYMVPSLATRRVRHGGMLWLYLVNSAEADVTVRLTAACGVRSVLGPVVEEDGVLRVPALGIAVLQAPKLWLTDHLHAEPADL